MRSATRRVTAAIALLATLTVAGCSSPTPAPPDAAVDYEAARAAVVELAQETVTLIGGESEVRESVLKCARTEDGLSVFPPGLAQLSYVVTVPDNSDADATLERIATRWAELGVDVEPESHEGHSAELRGSSASVPVIAVAHRADRPEPSYVIAGFSECWPGNPSEHAE